jgi:hypothetical protein
MKTDPSSKREDGPITRLSLTVGKARGLFVPCGLFAILVIGIHVGCNRLDHQLFALFNIVDAALDDTLTFIIQKVCALFDASAATTDLLTFRAVDFIDMDTKTAAAQYGALLYELATDVLLAVPAFFYGEQTAAEKLIRSRGSMWDSEVTTRFSLRTFKERIVRYFKDPTLLMIAGPLAAFCASIAGVFAVSREMEVAVHSMASKLPSLASASATIAGVLGTLVLFVVAWRMSLRVTIGAAVMAERRSRNDLTLSVPANKRRTRGLLTAFIALPIALLALEATPMLGTLRALIAR